MGGLAFDCEREGADGNKGGDKEARYGEKALDLRDLPLLALCLCECPPARPLPSLSLVHPSLLPLILPSWLFLVCVWLRSKELISSLHLCLSAVPPPACMVKHAFMEPSSSPPAEQDILHESQISQSVSLLWFIEIMTITKTWKHYENCEQYTVSSIDE